ncbi:PAS domain-containing protein [Candidatus Palauibacter sp.]|uniref:PAS domain-containing protein n=1 Tax=Candidatus Palauibacter sp. TaxID=3101350 RepID=UPI003C6ECE74
MLRDLSVQTRLLLIVDPDGVIRDINPQTLAMFGWSREEMVGSGVERLVPTSSRSGHEQHRRRYGQAPRARPMGQGASSCRRCARTARRSRWRSV